MLKVSENPPIRLGETPVTTYEDPWWVAHTKARSEKAFAWDLAALGIRYFLPLIERTTFSGGRKRRVLLPLFPSYVFVCGPAEDRYRALTTGRLCNVHPVPHRAKFVTEIAAVEAALEAKLPLSFHPFAVPGRQVRVVRGPLAGIAGKIVKHAGCDTLVLDVSILGQSAAVPVDIACVEPLTD